MKNIGYVIIAVLLLNVAEAQELAPLVKPEVQETQVMFRKSLQRRMDLQEKQNLPFFSKNGEISALLIQAVEEGLITPYRSDSCLNFMPDIIFTSNISIERQDNPFVGGGFTNVDFDSSSDDKKSSENSDELSGDEKQFDEIPKSLFSVIYLKEDMLFDRNRSRMYNYIRSLSLYLPASAGPEFNPGGFEKEIAHFKYDDVVNLFRGPYADKAIYYNNSNQASNLNMSDAFELRLFNAPIIKITNSENLDIRQIDQYREMAEKNPLTYIIIQQKYENDLIEYESEMWEY